MNKKPKPPAPPNEHYVQVASPMARPLPYSVEAEEAVIGSLMIDNSSIAKVATFLKVEDFYREKHQWLYAALLELHSRGEPADPVTLGDQITRMEKMSEVGGPAAVTELFMRVPTAIHVEHYAKIVERNSVMRQLVAAAERIAKMGYENQDLEVNDIIGAAEAELFGLGANWRTGGLQPIGQVLGEYYEVAEEIVLKEQAVMGVPTGYVDLDRLLGGLQGGNFIVLAARPSVGKTGLALGIAENAAVLHGARVAVFSLEMGSQELAQRLVSSRTGIDHQRLRTGPMTTDDLEQITISIEGLSDSILLLDDSPTLSPGELRSKLRRAMLQTGLDLVIIDYLQLMNAGRKVYDDGGENRQQEVAYISKELKNLAREFKIPIIALSQLSRKVEERADKRPLLSDLRDSGQVEQDADVVMFIYRDEIYNKNTQRPNIAEIIIAKHRNGPVGTVELRFTRELARFTNLEMYTGDPLGDLPPRQTANPSFDDIVF